MQQLIILNSGDNDQAASIINLDGENMKVLVVENDQPREVFTGSKFSVEKYANKGCNKEQKHEMVNIWERTLSRKG